MSLHYLRFNTETRFNYNPDDKRYSIQSDDIIYSMPYVLTLRLKRYLKGIASPQSKQLNDWYKSLPVAEKGLVTFHYINQG